jgi:hypothetical protein
MCKFWISLHINIQVELNAILLIWFYYMQNCPNYSAFCFSGKLRMLCPLIQNCMCCNSMWKVTKQSNDQVWYFLKYILRLSWSFCGTSYLMWGFMLSMWPMKMYVNMEAMLVDLDQRCQCGFLALPLTWTIYLKLLKI